MTENYQDIKKEFQELSDKLSQADFSDSPNRAAPEALAGRAGGQEAYKDASKKFARLSAVVAKIDQLEKVNLQIEESRSLTESQLDGDLVKLAQEEIVNLELQKQFLKKELKLLIQKLKDPEAQDEEEINEVILEIRAGAGGDEAALFALDLFKMYRVYAERKSWSFEIIDESRDELGGYKEVISEIRGKRVFSLLKYESGVHRVQRIPETEKSGRVHTSTATVAVMPVFKDVKLEIADTDLEIVLFKSSGAGGQNVNKVETAVRVKHLPTGITVSCQSERHQHQNKEKALSILKVKLFDLKRKEQQEKLVNERRHQIGTGERSEKIRTYNFPQDRITDHRVNLSWKNISRVLQGDLEIVSQEILKQLD